jgi:hypothetical protein
MCVGSVLRFISTNLLVEITSTKAAAKLLSWAVMRHQLISYFLYCAGTHNVSSMQFDAPREVLLTFFMSVPVLQDF